LVNNEKVRRWIDLGKKRIRNILFTQIVANPRTLEQKISDAGPSNQRVEPIHLTVARQELESEGVITPTALHGINWYSFDNTSDTVVQTRLKQLAPIYKSVTSHSFTNREGQALEIAVYRALCNQTNLIHYGGFLDLDDHDDCKMYQKEEPPSLISGKRVKGRFDFILNTPYIDIAGVEVKNVRPWIYPDSEIVKTLLAKCCAVDAVPVLIARRISYVAFSEVFVPCGVIIHQTFNQRYPNCDEELAKKASDKYLLGYHDIRVGNNVDARLEKFINVNLPKVLPDAAVRFHTHKDILQSYASGQLSYLDFHVELRKRLGIYE
jgi:hypothetical protein